jgi:hypothetical protein
MQVGRYVAAMVFMAIAVGCGSASNNDQGVSLLLTGFYPSSATSVNDAGISGVSVPFSDTEGVDGGLGGAVVASIGVQNNLVGQGARLQRAFLSYYIPGSSVQPPSTTYSLSRVLGPNGTPAEGDIPTTLPPGFAGLPNSAVSQVPVVPFEIRQWLVFNRNQLPEPPFVMNIGVYVNGITSAGDLLSTNEGILTATVVTDLPIGGGVGSDETELASGSPESTDP